MKEEQKEYMGKKIWKEKWKLTKLMIKSRKKKILNYKRRNNKGRNLERLK